MRRGAVVLFVLLLSGCGSCKDKAKAYLSEPPIEEYRVEVENQAPSAAKPATNMCGFPVEGLADVKVTIAEQSPRRFRVEGKPVTKGDAAIDKSKALVCIGIVSLVAWPIVEGDKATGYKWDPIVVERVETPGVSYTKPSSGGGWD